MDHSIDIYFLLKAKMHNMIMILINAQVTRFLSYTYAGSYFVFGFAADGKIFQNTNNFKHDET